MLNVSQRSMPQKKSRKKLILKWLVGLCLAGVLGIISFILSVQWGFWEPLPSPQQLADIRQSEATEIYADGGELMGKYFIFDRQPVAYEELPQHLINALIATEDARFYEHNGVDNRSLMRVVFKSILMGDESAGGGSTISQQLIKNLYPRKNHGVFSMPVAKTREAILAKRMENIYTKEEIITLYLNTVPFGDNTFGVESAAEKFFSKQAHELSLEESAVIVGMLKASNSYNPRLYPDRSKTRRNVVLAQMEKYGYLSHEETDIAQGRPLKLSYTPFNHDTGIAPYFRSSLQQKLEEWLEKYNQENNTELDLFTSGLKVETTINLEMQQMAEEAMGAHMKALQKDFEASYGARAPWLRSNEILQDALKKTPYYKKLQKKGLSNAQIQDSLSAKRQMELWDWDGAKVVKASTVDSVQHYLKFLNAGMLSVEPGSGAIRAWVGGINFKHFQYDHVMQAKRQVGSTFKPIVYAAALENGVGPCDYFSARPVTYANYDDWTPTNSGNIDSEKDYAVKAALANSINTVAVKVLEEAEIPNIIDLAHRMGIESVIPPVPSIALGSAELSVEELSKAYTAFLNNGRPSEPYFIKRIIDKSGKVLAEFEPEKAAEPVFSESTRQLMVEMMKEVVENGTATRLRWKYGLKNDIAGKTGTTQNNKDGWFVALTPRLVTVSWVGSDDHRIGFRTTAMGQGANSALPMYAIYQQKMNQRSDLYRYTAARFPPASTSVQNRLDCDEEKQPGFLQRIFVNEDKPQISKLKLDSAILADSKKIEPEKKEGLFKKIGNIFKRKKKNNE